MNGECLNKNPSHIQGLYNKEMLYILGGASRSGKTLLARRAVTEKQIPYFPLDALLGSLIYGAPELGMRYEDSFTDRSNKLWPVTRQLVRMLLDEEDTYVIEGDSILPAQVNELVVQQKPVRCCFVGYTELQKEEKLSLVREHHQGKADWTKGISDEALLPMIDQMIEFSTLLKEECTKYGIKYFDISHDFEGVRADIFEYLFAE
jgi:2-phosphoglycerate kinase